jgi:glycosyltransferase involved in cell wall biosynthesis
VKNTNGVGVKKVNGYRYDAIVMSGWTWEAFNVPERIALALSQLGATVLYCENPASFLRGKGTPLSEVDEGVYRTGLKFVGHRLNRIKPFFARIQSKILARQILRGSAELRLNQPFFIYPHGDFAFLGTEFKQRGFFLVHVCMDYPERGQERLIELSDLTLVIPKSLYKDLHTTYGNKIQMIPQVNRLPDSSVAGPDASDSAQELLKIPRPRLGYVGPAEGRLNLRVLDTVLETHPDWQFLHFGGTKCLPRENVHVLPWRKPEKLREVIANLDLGLMPYSRDDSRNMHCMPLKLFDYFAQGKPVVSTRILNLLEFSDTVYFGDDAVELCRAIQLALDEPPNSALKSRRMAIAKGHSIEALADVLSALLSIRGETYHALAV